MTNTNEQARIIYLAGPYTHEKSEVRLHRFQAITRKAADLIEQGHIVYSPITMTHPIDLILAARSDESTLGSEFWVKFDEAFMDSCGEIYVLMLDGWETSQGVKREIEFFLKRGKSIRYIEP